MHTARIAVIAITLLIGALTVCAQDRGTGSFDINKVRELSAGAQGGTDSANAATASHRESVNGVFIVIRIILTLAVVIGLILGATWLIKRFGISRTSSIGGRGVMDILEVLPLGQNKNMVLFKVNETVYLCGQTATTLSLIDKIDGAAATTILSTVRARPSMGQFKDAFNQFVNKMKKSS